MDFHHSFSQNECDISEISLDFSVSTECFFFFCVNPACLCRWRAGTKEKTETFSAAVQILGVAHGRTSSRCNVPAEVFDQEHDVWNVCFDGAEAEAAHGSVRAPWGWGVAHHWLQFWMLTKLHC